MKKKNIFILALLACGTMPGFAQVTGHVTGIVLDRWERPVAGALVSVGNNPDEKVATDKNGKFSINATENSQLNIETPNQSRKTVYVGKNNQITVKMDYASRPVQTGTDKLFTEKESTGAVATQWFDDVNHRSSKDVGNSLFGSILGLQALQNTGTYAAQESSFYLRGAQSSSGNTPLIIVDGMERDIADITPEEVENVTVLKDAAAAALYGYKGANGVLVITTKRGKYNSKEIKFSYDHGFNWQARKPKFVNAYTYANAVNEALATEGSEARYNTNQLNAYQNGTLPYNYANVNWEDETVRNTGTTDYLNMTFRGGSLKFRYYTLLSLQNNNGFIKSPNENDGYSTQDKYNKANIRSNWDIDLSPKTKLKINLLGTLAEANHPGSNVSIWELLYKVPSAAFPIKNEDGTWGGNDTWSGTLNPVGQATGAAYYKNHRRTFNADMTLNQNLDGITDGLSASFRLGYDNTSLIYEDHSRTYVYGHKTVATWNDDGTPATYATYSNGSASEMGSTASISAYNRLFNFYGSLNYDRTFGKHSLYAQARWEYEWKNSTGLNTTYYRQNASLYGHYGYDNRYFADLTMTYTGSNKLATNHKWTLNPTLSAAWIASNEEFMKNVSWVNFLKLRASWGLQNLDVIPYEDYWEQLYEGAGTGYIITSDFGYGSNRYQISRLLSQASKHENATKYNFGIDATLFNDFNVTFDAFFQQRKNIWVEATGKYTAIVGLQAPYEAAGRINSYGVELGLDYKKKAGDFTYSAGANFTWNGSKIKEMLEEPRAYDNLIRTGYAYGQIYGLKAIGLFKDAADIASSTKQTFGSVYPGDIKYEDTNKDGVVDENDVTRIGHSEIPEIYYSFNLGLDWKGLGFTAMFQGTGRYSAMLSSTQYRPLVSTNSLTQDYYDNRWTSSNLDAKYPRLAAQSSTNNYRNSTFWLRDRSFLKLRYVEAYYNLPKSVTDKLKVISDVKLYVRGVDLLCFDDMDASDPESYNNLTPMNRSIVAGFSLNF